MSCWFSFTGNYMIFYRFRLKMAFVKKRLSLVTSCLLILFKKLFAYDQMSAYTDQCQIEYRETPYNQSVVDMKCQGQDLELFPNLTQIVNLPIQRLDLRNNSFSKLTITSETFDGASITELNLDNNQFVDIEYNAFSAIDGLRKLTMNNCTLRSRDLDFLRNIPQLSVLSLRSNKIQEISDKSIFIGSPLESLDLSHNSNITILEDVLKALAPTLLHIRLDFCNIDVSNLHFLNGLSKLKTLSMEGAYSTKYNSIQNRFDLLKLWNLESLSLSNSGLKVIFANTFDGLNNLRYLDLSRNELTYQIFDVTNTLPNLQILRLSHNPNIQSIIKILNRNLSELHMEETGVNLISYDAFKLLGDSLIVLNLKSCQLPAEGMFLVDALRPLRSLKRLDLSYNHLKEIFNETFDNLNKLEKLDISGNILKFSIHDFSGLEESLRSLKLRNMTLRTLPLEALSTLENLLELDASFNNFSNITRNFFKGISVKTLNLTSCNISEIDNNVLHHFHKTNLILDGNHISDLEFLSLLGRNTFRSLTLNNNNLNCSLVELHAKLMVFETLEGRCTIGNRTEPLIKYFTNKFNMKLSSTANGIGRNQNLAVLLTVFISITLVRIFPCH